MTTNIKPDEEQLEDIVKKVIEIIEKQKKRKRQPLNLKNMTPQR